MRSITFSRTITGLILLAATRTTCVVAYTCQAAFDTCPYPDDDECDVDAFFCSANTDCNDCDPCMQYRFAGCEACTAANCVWCGAEARCLSEGRSTSSRYQAAPGYTCSAQDYVSTCDAQQGSNLPFSTPLLEASNWVYDIINVKPVWQRGIFGTGINIRVNDNGIDSNHPDLKDNFDFANSCPEGHLPPSPDLLHGTTCAAIAAGGMNGKCAVGIAPNASISGCEMFSDIDFQARQTFMFENQPTVHISSNSYVTETCTETSRRQLAISTVCPFNPINPRSPCGPGAECSNVAQWGGDRNFLFLSDECELEVVTYCQKYFDLDPVACSGYLELFVSCEYTGLTPQESDALAKGVTEGRNGKGIVYVFASGNHYRAGANVNLEGIQQSRYTISVGGVGKRGFHSSFSNPGAALFVSAPAGDSPEFYSNFIVAKGSTDTCHHATVGTSYACPVVSGVVALMLEANDNLTWRDVQEVLAKTSQMNDADHSSWVTNAGGYHHSYLYGFGVVDADAAVTEAMSWQLLPPENQIVGLSGKISLTVPDFQQGALETSITVDEGSGFVAESVSVFLNLQHYSRGDLEIILTAPSGTESIIHPGPRPENTLLQPEERWKFMTLRHWGETPMGEWKLRIVDKVPGDVGDCVDHDYFIDGGGQQPDLTCFYLTQDPPDCEGGAVLPNFFSNVASSVNHPDVIDPVNGLGPADACCACGGGFHPSSQNDVLKSWRIQIFGHYRDGSPTPPPTSGPTTSDGSGGDDDDDDDDDDDNNFGNSTENQNSTSSAFVASFSRTATVLILGVVLLTNIN